jgi:hypothetical protein
MVKPEFTPEFKIEANGSDVTALLQKNLLSLSLRDNDGEEADELELKVIGAFKRPKLKDRVRVWLGYDGELEFFGEYEVQNTERENNNLLTISATGVSFSSNIKVRQSHTYNNKTLKEIAGIIAKRNLLKLKSDAYIQIDHIVQHHESDIAFLDRLAKRYNLIFNIKNNTLVLKKRVKDEKKSDELPRVEVSANDCLSLRIQHTNKTEYKSAQAIWHDTKSNKQKEVTIGNGEPKLVLKKHFRDAKEAKEILKARLDSAGRGTKNGTLTISGRAVFAGSILVLSDSIEDDGEYSIKRVSHDMNASDGWKTTIDFES